MSSPVGGAAPPGAMTAGQSSLDEPDPEESVETRLTGRWPAEGKSGQSEGVVDGARSLLLMEAVDKRGDSEGTRRETL